MFSDFSEMVKGMGIFIILGQTILHFEIGKKYQLYMKLVISLMVVAQILFFVAGYYQKQFQKEVILSQEEYIDRWEENMQNLEERLEQKQEEWEANTQSMESKTEEAKEAAYGNPVQIEKVKIQ